MMRIVFLLTLIAFPALAASFPAKVVRVVAPEVLVVQAAGQEKTVVLRRTIPPASSSQDSEVARRNVEALVLGQQVEVEPKTRDDRGRSVVLVRLSDGRTLNNLLYQKLPAPLAHEEPAAALNELEPLSSPKSKEKERVYTVTKKMVQEAEELDLLTLVAQHAPRLLRDANGNALGLTATNISGIPLATALGFQEGDIISQVNGVKLLDEMQVFTLYSQFEDTKDFTVTLLREGKPKTLQIKLP